MRYYIFESGSKGNCTLISSGGRYLLIDNGLSMRRFKSYLSEIGVLLEEIGACLVTHSHSDHTAGLKVLNPHIIHCTKPTYEVDRENILHPFNEYKICGFNIKVYPTSHDASESICFLISDEKDKLVYVTDTGFIPKNVLDNFKDADYYIFESNHDPKMQLKTNRPAYLIKRIMGDRGHLSNEDSALYLSEIISNRTKEICLAHLSEDANSEQVALDTFNHIMALKHIDVSKINVRCASQHKMIRGGEIDK